MEAFVSKKWGGTIYFCLISIIYVLQEIYKSWKFLFYSRVSLKLEAGSACAVGSSIAFNIKNI